MADEVRSEKPEPAAAEPAPAPAGEAKKPKEVGGPKGPEPTRYGDWERGGLWVDC